jgi:hypothetical protein
MGYWALNVFSFFIQLLLGKRFCSDKYLSSYDPDAHINACIASCSLHYCCQNLTKIGIMSTCFIQTHQTKDYEIPFSSSRVKFIHEIPFIHDLQFRRYIVWDTKKASLNKLYTNKRITIFIRRSRSQRPQESSRFQTVPTQSRSFHIVAVICKGYWWTVFMTTRHELKITWHEFHVRESVSISRLHARVTTFRRRFCGTLSVTNPPAR